jgi:SAM-dependent methyltransferase
MPRTIKSLLNSALLRAKIYSKIILSVIDKRKDNEKLMVNIGGGYFFKRHWKVLDHPTKWYTYKPKAIDVDFDLTSKKPLPFKDNSVYLYYSAHVFEHIPDEFCQDILNEIYRTLKKGGAIRIMLPDFDKAHIQFKKRNDKFFKTNMLLGKSIEERFLSYFATYLIGKISNKKLINDFNKMSKEKFADKYTSTIPRESQKISGGNHINWWNFNKFDKRLKRAGFSKIYTSDKGKSKYAEMREHDFDKDYPEYCLFIEAIK